MNDLPDSDGTEDLNVSQPCGVQLPEVVSGERERSWRIQHADFVAGHNATVDNEGVPLEARRSF